LSNREAFAPSVEEIATQLFCELRNRFPVCCASDEFYFFPQLEPADSGTASLRAWDDFSPETVADTVKVLARADARLSAAPIGNGDDPTPLRRLCRTLAEQLAYIRCHRTQPTWSLTIVVAGLVDALQAQDTELLQRRVEELPAFLQQAQANLDRVPALFAEIGVHMANQAMTWLQGLEGSTAGLPATLQAVADFSRALEDIHPAPGFRLQPEHLESIVSAHMGCGASVAAVLDEIEDELSRTRRVLEGLAANLAPGRTWRETLHSLPPVPAPDGPLPLFEAQVKRLEEHCVGAGLVAPDFVRRCRVAVEPVPDMLAAVRAAAAYSARPGHPARGGTFYVYAGESGIVGTDGLHPEYRMTTAHETWPGHHLLDSSRWDLRSPVRRALEFPVFYEGWACFAETLLVDTGLFTEPIDPFILAARRYRRAARGRVDLLLQTGQTSIADAVRELREAGLPPAQASDSVPKYALRPGYQACYAIGQRRMERRFRRESGGNAAAFVERIMRTGETIRDG